MRQQIAQRSTRLFWPPLNFDICSHDIHSTMPNRARRPRHSASVAPLKIAEGTRSQSAEGRAGRRGAERRRPLARMAGVASPAVGVSSAVISLSSVGARVGTEDTHLRPGDTPGQRPRAAAPRPPEGHVAEADERSVFERRRRREAQADRRLVDVGVRVGDQPFLFHLCELRTALFGVCHRRRRPLGLLVLLARVLRRVVAVDVVLQRLPLLLLRVEGAFLSDATLGEHAHKVRTSPVVAQRLASQLDHVGHDVVEETRS